MSLSPALGSTLGVEPTLKKKKKERKSSWAQNALWAPEASIYLQQEDI